MKWKKAWIRTLGRTDQVCNLLRLPHISACAEWRLRPEKGSLVCKWPPVATQKESQLTEGLVLLSTLVRREIFLSWHCRRMELWIKAITALGPEKGNNILGFFQLNKDKACARSQGSHLLGLSRFFALIGTVCHSPSQWGCYCGQTVGSLAGLISPTSHSFIIHTTPSEVPQSSPRTLTYFPKLISTFPIYHINIPNLPKNIS